jgi:hypothetical protein
MADPVQQELAALPSDGLLYTIQGTSDVYVMFDVGNGVRLSYQITPDSGVDWKSMPTRTVSASGWASLGTVNAGDAAELVGFSAQFSNYRQFWNSILDQVMGPYNPARADSEVLRVIAEFAARPDMDPAELQNSLQATEWFRSRTNEELEWNSLQPAEQERRLLEAGVRAADTWFQYVGETVTAEDPRIAGYIERLASGQIGWGAFSSIVREQAIEVAESPWARQVRTEQEAQLQRGVDIENTAQNVRNTLNRWGLRWTEQEIMGWAKQIVSKERSDDDLMQAVKSAATVLYPWKDPEQETLTAAQPWLETYERMMEKTGSLRTAEVQRALTNGQSAADFERDLKRSSEWLTTRNARNELTGLIASMGSKMGFL